MRARFGALFRFTPACTSRGAERRNFCGLLVLGRVEQQVWDNIRVHRGVYAIHFPAESIK